MRFEVSRVMDTIERRLTTDIVMAQAVVDLDAITRYTDLDSGRPVNLIRIGMVVDALGRYLRDGGAMIYAVAPRTLLSEPELTAKERMVLGRWTEDGLIESTEDAAAARVLEIGELTGLPIISRDGYRTLAAEHEWLRDHPLRILTVSRRFGGARLIDGTDDAAPPPPTATGSSAGPQSAGPESAGPESAGPESAGPESAGPESAGPESAGPESAG
ncbi:MAG: hypothetical protein QOI74_330, partial [Micromonosporaceae bacterium]|nr:hypothetical protein [Micromonosporaceae bacterium]